MQCSSLFSLSRHLESSDLSWKLQCKIQNQSLEHFLYLQGPRNTKLMWSYAKYDERFRTLGYGIKKFAKVSYQLSFQTSDSWAFDTNCKNIIAGQYKRRLIGILVFLCVLVNDDILPAKDDTPSSTLSAEYISFNPRRGPRQGRKRHEHLVSRRLGLRGKFCVPSFSLSFIFRSKF